MGNELVIDVRGLADDALHSRQPDEDLDEAILRAAKARNGERGFAAFTALKAALDYQVQRSGNSRCRYRSSRSLLCSSLARSSLRSRDGHGNDR